MSKKTEIDPKIIDRAAHAIKECMANEGWKLWGVQPARVDKLVRNAAELAVRWAMHPEEYDEFRCATRDVAPSE